MKHLRWRRSYEVSTVLKIGLRTLSVISRKPSLEEIVMEGTGASGSDAFASCATPTENCSLVSCTHRLLSLYPQF